MRCNIGCALALFLAATPAEAQQDLGHKILGTLGSDAGIQIDPGLHVGDRVLVYGANTLKDRAGASVPVGLDLDAITNGIGVVGAIELSSLGMYLNVSLAIPLAHLSLTTDRPVVTIDLSGVGDIYVQPVKLGWRWRRAHLVAGYAFYAPTGHFDAGGKGGVGTGQWTSEFSAGGAVFFDEEHRVRLSMLGSCGVNSRKRGVDITKGATMQVQGGLAVTLLQLFDIGVAGYALWQVADDTGTALPNVLRGARDRVFGLGPELAVALPPIRGKLTVRYERDFGVRSRPAGEVLTLGLSLLALKP